MKNQRTLHLLIAAAMAVAVFLSSSPAVAITTYVNQIGTPQGSYAGGHSSGTLLIGDEQFTSLGVSYAARFLRDRTGRRSYVNAASRAASSNYAVPGHQQGNALLADYARLFKPGLVVMALGNHDGRMFGRRVFSDLDPRDPYRDQASFEAMIGTMAFQTLAHAKCIMIVGAHTPQNEPARLWINDSYKRLARKSSRIHYVDWHEYARYRGDWVDPYSGAMTAAGRLHYLKFIGDWAAWRQAKGCA